MDWQLRPTRVKYPFFAIAAQRKVKEKKIPRVGGVELDGWQDGDSPTSTKLSDRC